jgi:hypothetical protein
MAARAGRALAALVPLLAAFWIWHPLLGAFFYADDFIHLFDLVTVGPVRFLTQIWGGHLYLVRNGIFLGMFRTFGLDPQPWFWSVLVTHLLNVLLLYRAIRRVGGTILAAVGAIVWGTNPILAGTLGWYSVYGQVLLTTLALFVVGRLARTVAAHETLTVPTAAAWGTLLAVGGACFGSGLGIAAAFPLAVMVALEPRQRPSGAVATLAGAALAILTVYVAVRIFAALQLDPRSRVLLSPSALLAELPAAVALTVQLLAFGAYVLPFGVLAPNLDHATTMAIGVAVLATMTLGGFAADASMRRWLLALALLTVVAYGTVAFGRTTSLEFLKLPATHAAAWPRYHYFALALLAFTGCTALAAVQRRGPAAARVVHGVGLGWAAACLALLALRPPALDLHEAARRETTAVLERFHAAAAATPPGGTVTIENQPFASAAVPWLFPGWAGLFVIAFPGESVDGRQVRFQAYDADWALAQARGGRIAALVQR